MNPSNEHIIIEGGAPRTRNGNANRRLRTFRLLLSAGILLTVLSVVIEPAYGLQITYLSRPARSPLTTLYTFDLDRRLTTVLFEASGLRRFVWSPDGRYVLLTIMVRAEERSYDQLHVLEVAARRAWLLVGDAFAYGAASWAPDSRHIVYTRASERGVAVFTIDIAGTDERFITSTDVYPWYPTWSPDGKWIAFTDYFDNLYVVSTRGGTARDLEYKLSGANYGYGRLAPLWSADSQRLIYYRDGAVYCTLVEPPTEETCATNVNSPPSVAFDNRIAFTSDAPPALWILSPPGLKPRSFALPEGQRLVAPRWSSDGQHILVIHPTESDQIVAPFEIYDFEVATNTWKLLDTVVVPEQTVWRPQ